MTNLQKATNLISDILDLKLGVGDIVIYGEVWKILIAGKANCYCLPLVNTREHVTATWVPTSILKLIHRNITLPMVLEAMNEKDIEILIDGEGKFYEWSDIHREHCPNGIKWQLRKDNKDCSLFDQKNEELYKFIIKVLK